MSLRKVKGNFDRIFDKTLTDLVRGIRNNKENEAKYITQCIEEIKEELRHDSLFVKANAISKLTYLQMLGYDISWSSFNVIEVMSSTKFSHKRIGYLAASQCFHENTEVMMLTTNMIRKDLNSQNMYDAGCAMSGLACFVTTDISRDLANDVLTLLNSTKPYLRKKAVLLLYKIFLKFPDALKPAFPRLKEKLEDPDPGVQSAAVNVICELARKNPKNYLSLAPVFFKLMTNSTNNWMLIKIIKLFGSLTPLEPRLGKKLIEPLTNLIHSTSAMSLLYECINTVIAVLISISSGLPNHNASIQLCVQKLRILIEDSDQNLKYLGLLAMSKILKSHPKSVQAHKDLVLSCLDDKDESIRSRALDLLYGMVTKKNLMEIVQRLVKNVNDGHISTKFRDELISKLIDICSQNDYQFIVNFEWYLSVLIELARVEGGTIHGTLIAQQILDVAIRVDAIRQFATEQMSILLENSSIFLNNSSVSEVLYAAAWICGEFADYLPDQESTIYNLLSIFSFPPHITAVFIQNASKILSKIAANPKIDDHQFITLSNEINEVLEPYLKNQNLEIQERAASLFQINGIFKSMKMESLEKKNQSILLDGDELNGDGTTVNDQVEQNSNEENNISVNFESLFYAYPLNPVAAKAQRKVPIPVGLDLEVPFIEMESDDEDDNEIIDDQGIHLVEEPDIRMSSSECDEEEIKHRSDVKGARRFEQENNPHYLKSKKANKKTKKVKKLANLIEEEEEKEGENVQEASEMLSDEFSLVSHSNKSRQTSIPGLVSSDRFLLDMKSSVSKKNKLKPTKGKKKKSVKSVVIEEDEEEDEPPKVSIRALEMPEGADLNENDDDDCGEDANLDPHHALSKITLNDIVEPSTKKNAGNKVVSKKNKKLDSKHDNKKKSTNKSSKVNDLIGGENNTTKTSKKSSKTLMHDETLIDEKKKKSETLLSEELTKKSTKKKSNGAKTSNTTKKATKKSKNTKNRAEYEETLGMEISNLNSSTVSSN
ncbi:hypothetical protein RDWZM_001526 [Blomia tropicalis]|uniref:AP-3 complex subunit delta n=1 Tax=Blomia tropicalis TaxID=40697 RepID=A0A9Q0RQQ2_BLOTA|nr:AP-3 complex subunit delta-1 [Blomia tropicalis]KAJ6222981.1 hypothetical protein RDWZM_001526 [Blomia tropicalis]